MSFLFLLCAELMAIDMRANKKILGINYKDVNMLLGQFADDTDITSMFKQQSMDNIFEVLETYRRTIGFEVNYNKTNVYRMGSLKDTQARLYTQKDLHWTNIGVNVLGIEVRDDPVEICEANYDSLINKTQAILESWSRRSLSLFGKITVVNMLIASLFIYKMMVVPTMLSRQLKKVNSIIERFIWNGARPKIPFHELMLLKQQGGANLCNLHTRDRALKATWPAIIENNEVLQPLVWSMLSEELQSDIWKCALTEEDMFENSPLFWRQVLSAWNQYADINDMVRTPTFLWYNSSIRIANKPIFYKHAYAKGLCYVHQLYVNGCPISVKEAHDLYALTAMEYNSLVSAIPKEWKQNQPKVNTEIRLHHSASKIYKSLIKPMLELTRKALKWEQELECSVDYSSLCSAMRTVYSTTNVTKLRSFQYRLYHRALITNIHLKLWGKEDCDLCSQCRKEHERETYLPNFLALILKQYVYRKRCLKQKLNATEFINEICLLRNMEKYIAQKNNKMSKHQAKWNINIDD